MLSLQIQRGSSMFTIWAIRGPDHGPHTHTHTTLYTFSQLKNLKSSQNSKRPRRRSMDSPYRIHFNWNVSRPLFRLTCSSLSTDNAPESPAICCHPIWFRSIVYFLFRMLFVPVLSPSSESRVYFSFYEWAHLCVCVSECVQWTSIISKRTPLSLEISTTRHISH